MYLYLSLVERKVWLKWIFFITRENYWCPYRIGGGEIEATNMVPSHHAVIVLWQMVVDRFRLNSRMQSDIT